MSLQNISIRWHNVPRLWPTQILLHLIVIKFDLAHNIFSRHILAMLGTVLSNHPFCGFLKKERQLQPEYLNSVTTDTWFIHGPSLILKKIRCRVCKAIGAKIWQVPNLTSAEFAFSIEPNLTGAKLSCTPCNGATG